MSSHVMNMFRGKCLAHDYDMQYIIMSAAHVHNTIACLNIYLLSLHNPQSFVVLI